MHNVNFEKYKDGIILFKKTDCSNETVRRIAELKSKMFVETPFWGYFAASLQSHPTDEIETFSADYHRFYFNPEYIDNALDTEVMNALYHVTTHIMLFHLERQESRREEAWVIAADVTTMHTLYQFYEDVTKYKTTQRILDLFDSFAIRPKDIEKYYGWSTEKVYKDLNNKMKDAEMPKTAGSGTSGHLNTRQIKQIEKAMDGHSCELEKTRQQYQASVNQDIQDLNKSGAEALAKNAVEQFEKDQGFIPEELKTFYDLSQIPPVIPWYILLEQYLQSNIVSDLTWKKPSKTMMANDIYMPSLLKNDIHVVVAMDTSGSITDDEYKKFATETHSILSGIDNISMTLIDCDAMVQHVEEIDVSMAAVFDMNTKARHGHGGTRFEPVFDWVEENGVDVDVLIYFTDLMGSFPKIEPDYPTIWVVHNPYQRDIIHNIPFGEAIDFTE